MRKRSLESDHKSNGPYHHGEAGDGVVSNEPFPVAVAVHVSCDCPVNSYVIAGNTSFFFPLVRQTWPKRQEDKVAAVRGRHGNKTVKCGKRDE
ncbi:hypothetical protein BaRGS_00013315 [Batillaria attramentaria]|uniref:Uncharacterized protein n=1 Tax=Batillaria attramentaria TaxID=370345 RepID=A0ABD0L7Z1_9CAEN